MVDHGNVNARSFLLLIYLDNVGRTNFWMGLHQVSYVKIGIWKFNYPQFPKYFIVILFVLVARSPHFWFDGKSHQQSGLLSREK